MKPNKQQPKLRSKPVLSKPEKTKIKKQTIKIQPVKEIPKKKSISYIKKKDSEGKQKPTEVKPETIIKQIERNMKELKRFYYQSFKSNKNSSRHSSKQEQQYRSCRQSFQIPETKKSKTKKQTQKPKEKDPKKSLIDIYNFYKHSVGSSLSRYNSKRPSTPLNSESSKKHKNSSTKIHITSTSMVSNKQEENVQNCSSVNQFDVSRPVSPYNQKDLLKEKVKKKSHKKEGPFNKKEQVEEIRFDNIPQIHSSLYNQNMPIMEEDSKYEVSSCVERISKQKKETQEIQSLAGCEIPKVGDTEFDDIQVVSIQL